MSFPSEAMRLLLVSDGRGDLPRLQRILAACIAGGLRAMQLREGQLSARELADFCRELRPMLQSVDGLLIINDRADLVAAGFGDGLHLGGGSLSPGDARRFLPDTLLGFSAHDAREIAWAKAEGADYVSLSPLLPSSCKPGQPAIGLQRAEELTRGAGLPVLWLGGLDAEKIGRIASAPAGFALRSGLCDVLDPESQVRQILGAIS